MFKRFLYGIVVLGAIVPTPSWASALGREVNPSGHEKLRHGKRSRLLELDPGFAGRAPRAGAKISFDLFSDYQPLGFAERVRAPKPGSFVAQGRLLGVEHGHFVLASQDGVLRGIFYDPAHGYTEISYVGQGRHQVIQLDRASMGECGGAVAADLTLLGSPQGTLGIGGAAAYNCAPTWAPVQLDLMVVYTPKALADAGGLAAIQAQIAGFVAEANMDYQNSGLNLELRLVHTEQVAYTDSGVLNTDLSRLTAPADGFMDNVHTLRNSYGADIVTLFVGDVGGASVGLANEMTVMSPAFESSAFNVVSTLADPSTMVHEIGHNLGAAHDFFNAGSSGPFPYGYGRQFTAQGNAYRTLMAYAPGERVPYFSNPNLTFLGTPLGVPDAADNVRCIQQTMLVAKDFRAATGLNAQPAASISSPPDLTAYTALDAVTITAAASDSDGSVAQVDFYMDQLHLGSVTGPPFGLTYGPLPAGNHVLWCEALDDQGGLTVSCPSNISVASTLPAPWADTDIYPTYQGLPLGSAGQSGGVFTVSGASQFISTTGDPCHMVYQQLCGDGIIQARVLSVQATHASAYAGVCMRESLTDGAPMILTAMTSSAGYLRGVRTTYGGSAVLGAAAGSAVAWVKISRTANTFTGYRSADGVTWTIFQPATAIAMNSVVYVGLVVASHDVTQLNTSTFDNVSVTNVFCPSSTRTPSFTYSPSATRTGSPTRTVTVTPSVTLTRTPTRTASPTPTDSPSRTASMTFSASPSFSASPTASPSPTYAGTPTATPTQTRSATPSFTPSATPSATMTRSWTSSPTASPTPSASRTGTPSPSPSATRTGTPSATQSATQTKSATASATPSATRTNSPTKTTSPSSTATRSASPSPSASPSATVSPTPSATRTDSPTRTASPSPTATRSASPSPTASPTPSASRTGTPSPSPSATRTGTPSATQSATQTKSATDSPTPSVTRTDSPTSTASPTPSVTRTDSPTKTATPSPSATRSASPSPTFTKSPSNSPSPSVTRTPTASASATLSPSFSATPSLSASPSPSATASMSPSDTATASPSFSPSPSHTSSPTASPTLTATPAQSPTLTLSTTSSPTPAVSATASPTPSQSPTPATATPSPTLGTAPAQQPPQGSEGPEISSVVAVPNPASGSSCQIAVQLQGNAESFVAEIFSPGFTLIRQEGIPLAAGPGLSLLPLQLQGLPAGLAYLRLRAIGHGKSSAKTAKIFYLP